MKTRNILIVGTVFLIFYAMAGSQLAGFYFGGKKAILAAGEEINKLCNEQGACPQTLSGWREQREGLLRKDSMLYFLPAEKPGDGNKGKPGPQSFRIVYSMPMPDNWFEVQGGVGKKVSSGWKSR